MVNPILLAILSKLFPKVSVAEVAITGVFFNKLSRSKVATVSGASCKVLKVGSNQSTLSGVNFNNFAKV